MHNQRIACKELGLNVDKEIKNDKEKFKWNSTKCKNFYTNYKNFLGGWITAHCSHLDGGRSLAFGTILALKS